MLLADVVQHQLVLTHLLHVLAQSIISLSSCQSACVQHSPATPPQTL